MTCIIGFLHEGNAVLAGDKIGVSDYTKRITRQPKVFHNDGFMIGYTASFRMGQILQYNWNPPTRRTGQSAEDYLYTDVITSIRKTFEDNWFLDKAKNQWGGFILIYENRIYEVGDDLSITESVNGIEACGCGRELARGALAALLEYETDLNIILKKVFKIVSDNITMVSSEYDYILSKPEVKK